MNNKLCSNWILLRKPNRFLPALFLAAVILGAPGFSFCGVPDWLRDAARVSLPKYADDVKAVVLLDDQATTVNPNGEIKTRYRVAIKILRPEGRRRGSVGVYSDSETRLTYLKGWCIPANGHEYEVKEGDAVETSLSGAGELYSDTRVKVLVIPAADPGNVIGYEYEQRRRPYIRQDVWSFQDDIPVRESRFELALPQGWKFDTFWLNHAAEKPEAAGENHWVWQLNDLPAIEDEPEMPAWRAVAGRMAVIYSGGGELEKGSQANWASIGRWYANLSRGRRDVSPEIRQKVTELTANAKTKLAQIQALAGFVQRDIRYVAIEIGVGGYQPHAARDILVDGYGDCKDKATLLSAMLQGVGVESYYVLINTNRGVVEPNFPSALTFNHAILAIRLPADIPTESLYALHKDPKLGNLLFFDPTDSMTQLGYLPGPLQENYGLLVTQDGGELVELPLLAPSVNRLFRAAKLSLTPSGDLAGVVEEIRWGVPDAIRRAQLLAAPQAERQKKLESFLGSFLGGLVLESSHVENLENYDKNLVVTYTFLARDYAKRAGNLLLIRPRVLGEKSMDLTQEKGKERKYPVEFDSTSLETDMFDIAIPSGYEVDELPAPVDIKSPFGEYTSKIEFQQNVLKYQRTLQISSVEIPADRVDELKKFFSEIDTDQRSSAVLKEVTMEAPAVPPAASKP
jgi:hypothetical protein